MVGSIKDNLELWEWWKQGGEAWIHKKIWKRQGKGHSWNAKSKSIPKGVFWCWKLWREGLLTKEFRSPMVYIETKLIHEMTHQNFNRGLRDIKSWYYLAITIDNTLIQIWCK